MKIAVTLEVESRQALAAILKAGSEQTLYSYQVHGFEILPSNGTTEKETHATSSPPRCAARRQIW